MNYVGKPLAYVLATPERPDDADNPLRLAFGNEAGDRDIAAFARAVRLPGRRRLRLDRERRDRPRVRAPRRARSAGRYEGVACSTRRPARSARPRCSTKRRGGQPRRGGRRAREHRGRRPVRRATTTTRPPTPSGCAAGCTGAATSPTATPTGSSTTPAAPPTGCGSTARTSRPRRSSGSCCGTRPSPGRRLRRTRPARRRPAGRRARAQDDATLDPDGSRSSCRRRRTSARSSGRARPNPRALPRTATNKVLKRELIARAVGC